MRDTARGLFFRAEPWPPMRDFPARETKSRRWPMTLPGPVVGGQRDPHAVPRATDPARSRRQSLHHPRWRRQTSSWRYLIASRPAHQEGQGFLSVKQGRRRKNVRNEQAKVKQQALRTTLELFWRGYARAPNPRLLLLHAHPRGSL